MDVASVGVSTRTSQRCVDVSCVCVRTRRLLLIICADSSLARFCLVRCAFVYVYVGVSGWCVLAPMVGFDDLLLPPSVASKWRVSVCCVDCVSPCVSFVRCGGVSCEPRALLLVSAGHLAVCLCACVCV